MMMMIIMCHGTRMAMANMANWLSGLVPVVMCKTQVFAPLVSAIVCPFHVSPSYTLLRIRDQLAIVIITITITIILLLYIFRLFLIFIYFVRVIAVDFIQFHKNSVLFLISTVLSDIENVILTLQYNKMLL